jgi:hypothetical protein
MKVGETWKTHQGGTVTVTKTGLIHRAGNAYSGKAAAEVPETVAKKPRKKSGG